MSDAWDRAFIEAGYAYCRPCAEWHRPPECWIDQRGVPALDLSAVPTCPTKIPEEHMLGEFPMTCYRCHMHADA